MRCGWLAPHPCHLTVLPIGPGRLRQDTCKEAISAWTRRGGEQT